ncbi:MAG: hypothetical protein SVX43_04230 [Cyanobacteriota bacterium]|nr:hypothetical protein [Cyanobacteriota bacterium]
MKHHLAIATALLATLGVMAPSPMRAQARPVEVSQAGFVQPVARYNPRSTAEVRLVNRSGYTLLYDLTSDEAEPRRLPPGGTVVMTNIRPDSYVLIYSDDASEQGSSPIDFNVTASGSSITTRITRSSTIPGDQTMHLHGNGGIFVY